MPCTCNQCGQPATGRQDPDNYRFNLCIGCAAVESLNIPVTPERRDKVPDVIVNGPAWAITKDIRSADKPDGSMWLHQARALQELNSGANVGIATATASGKSRIFQLWTLHQVMTDPDATALVFYPNQGPGRNDQANSWNRRCADVGLPAETVGQINGDVPPNQRDSIISNSRVVIMTPDVCHAWLTRNAEKPPVKRFLRGLRTIIIDEAHTYESIFGSNSAYLFRRLVTPGNNRRQPQAAPVHCSDRHHPGTGNPPQQADRPGIPRDRPGRQRGSQVFQDASPPALPRTRGLA